MKTEKFNGTASQMRVKNQFLSSEDFDGMGNVELTIDDVLKHQDVIAQDGKKEPIVFSLKFKEGSKELWLNATNRKAIVGMYSANTKEWRGKKVKLYVQDGIRDPKTGQMTKGLRVRAEKGTNATKKL